MGGATIVKIDMGRLAQQVADQDVIDKMTKAGKALSPNGSRSFPSEDRVKGHGQWNHYYVRAINGEVRLWVNGKEVSGGTNCSTTTGYLCLEAEGSPIEFRNIRVRELA